MKAKLDEFVKSLQSRHFRETCPRPDRGAGVSRRGIVFLDSRFCGNENNGHFLIFYETMKFETGNLGLEALLRSP